MFYNKNIINCGGKSNNLTPGVKWLLTPVISVNFVTLIVLPVCGGSNIEKNFYLISLWRMEFTTVRTMLNNNAQPKLSTRNPGTRPDVSKISNALITKVNNPSVRMVIGSVRRKSNGFIVTLIIPRISAAIIAVVKPAMWTPWSK